MFKFKKKKTPVINFFWILYIKVNMVVSVCLGSVWKILSVPVPCEISPHVTDSREKRNQEQSDFSYLLYSIDLLFEKGDGKNVHPI
jgi:hypothetical protein